MRFNKYILITLFGLIPVFGIAQEVPLYSNYTVNPMIYNPAHVGINNELKTFLHHRTQWSGFKGSPVSHLITLSAPLSSINSGIGFSIQNDQRGLFNELTGSVKYAYHAKINQQSIISLGVGLDIQNRILRIGESTVKDIEDPILNEGSVSNTFMDASFGLEYQWKNKLMLGVSIPQLMEGNSGNEDVSIKNTRHIIGQASYMFDVLSSGTLKVQPIVLTRFVSNIPLQYDVNVLVHYKNMFLVGAGYRSAYAINFHAGIHVKNIDVRYVYDFITVNSNINEGLSHEVVLGYTLDLNRNETIHDFPPEEPFVEEKPITKEEPIVKKEPLTPEKVKEILYLLINEFFETSHNNPEEQKKIKILRDTIYKLLEGLDELK
jgi:type IX secretion system PorP/SprF family membrane protein